MLTPGYSLTSTERVLPRLALDFTTAVLDPRVTVTRALDTATRFNSSGFLEVVSANTARFDFNPTTLACNGLLIEESRINTCLQSTSIGTSPWNLYAGEVTVTAASGISIDGTNNAFKITGNSGLARLGQAITVSANTTYTFSWYVKNVDANYVEYFNSASGELIQYTSLINTSTWTRITKTVTTGAATTSITIQFVRGLPAGQSVLICYPQNEAGAFVTSVIPTTTTSLTRNADVVTMTGTNFSDWYNATEGTFAVWHDLIGYTSNNMLLAATDAGTTNVVQLYLTSSSTGRFLVRNSGSDQALLNTTTTIAGVSKTVGAYKADSFAAASNGENPATDPLGTIPTVDRLGIGSRLAFLVYNGHIQKVSYWPQRLTTPEVQAFSK